jgi:hypothetical protein
MPTGTSLNKLPIEPSGWEDPDFKIVKKSDDGTNIWGDPENHKQMKVQKWSYFTKHIPNPLSLKSALTEQDQFQMQNNPASTFNQSSSSATPVTSATPALPNSSTATNNNLIGQTVSSPSSQILNSNPQWTAQLNNSNNLKLQSQQSLISQWDNTPAAPSPFLPDSTSVTFLIKYSLYLEIKFSLN